MAKEHGKLVKEHFELKYYDYDNLIRKLIPRYEEMHQRVVDFVDLSDTASRILDLGVGTGQTALALLRRFPQTHLDGYDIAPKMLEQARARLGETLKRTSLYEGDIASFSPEGPYDACVAVLSIHHLDEKQKPVLFSKVYKALKPGAIFAVGDIIKFPTDEETKRKEEEWRQFLHQTLGQKEGKYWFENYQEEDLPSTVPDQLRWLREAGFQSAESVWQHMNYAVFFGKK